MDYRASTLVLLAIAAPLLMAPATPGSLQRVDPVSSRYQAEVERASKSYRLEATGPGHFAEAEIQLIDGRAPVELEAEVVRTEELPGGLRETSRRISWRTEAGQIRQRPGAGEISRARWTLPEESRAVRIAAEAWITLEPRSRREKVNPAIVYKRVDFQFLTSRDGANRRQGYLDGYHIGEYPDPDDPDLGLKYAIDSNWHRLHPHRYRPPSDFYLVDSRIKHMRISPHVTLGHFAIDFPWHTLGMPQYVAIDMNLVQKLEDLIALMKREASFPVTGITAIYGFRPPSFNLGTIAARPDTTKKVPFSMHQYGRAMDFIIDEDGDLVLDDLNRDGRHDFYDTIEIMRYVNMLDRQYRAEGRWEKVGGAGLYDSHDYIERIQTPYIHVDVRGFQDDSTGQLIRWADEWPAGDPVIPWGQM